MMTKMIRVYHFIEGNDGHLGANWSSGTFICSGKALKGALGGLQGKLLLWGRRRLAYVRSGISPVRLAT